ncbi:hypothetical protein RHGRI_023306 [Rhododendron griersonianum]|uniref:Uncharacterized protein n=1 Tax=Rhododendron griersonianum TaxID=479676 RepID=A0AAV6JA10_9ERIC|nr:hypothetical protein RHGRI_023306 [Rhododendron griersonianum]
MTSPEAVTRAYPPPTQSGSGRVAPNLRTDGTLSCIIRALVFLNQTHESTEPFRASFVPRFPEAEPTKRRNPSMLPSYLGFLKPNLRNDLPSYLGFPKPNLRNDGTLPCFLRTSVSRIRTYEPTEPFRASFVPWFS